jgi:hypothetical protein
MSRFRVHAREPLPAETAGELPLDEVRNVIAQAIQPAHFFVGNPLRLEWQYSPSEEIAWEIYQGRLLEAAHTRLRETFESWNIFCVEAGSRSLEPILSLKLHRGSRRLYVTRAVYCYAWEGYHAGDNVYLSCETRKWVRELVGTVHLERFPDPDDLRDEIICLLFQAVVGCSRLPLQSMEAPLPAFSLGWLGYGYRGTLQSEPHGSAPLQSFWDLIERGLHGELAWLEKAKLLETVLRSTPATDLGVAAELFLNRWCALGHSTDELAALCRTLFNEVALSPYTDFVDKMLKFLKILESQGHLSAEAHADFLGYMLRHNARHLTAYDLITFHHRGANYPDALLLDAVLKDYLTLIESRPELFIPARDESVGLQTRKRIRRRALRQAWLLRRRYEGLPVPDLPTSPGENTRVLPSPYGRVPEEQIFEPGKRTRRLFADEPLLLRGERSRAVLRQCFADLRHPEELQELGMAIFLDRPFGSFKAATEPDRTLLLSYETFSRSMAERRLQEMAKDPALNLSAEIFESYRHNLFAAPPVQGLPITRARREQRPGAVALHDAARVADDFLVLRTTRQTVQAFLQQFDIAALAERCSVDYFDAQKRVWIVTAASTRSGPEGILDVYDERLRQRLELQVDPSRGYRSRAGQEYPVVGLRVLRAWEGESAGSNLRAHTVEQNAIALSPRD